jgi:hypothetical protein
VIMVARTIRTRGTLEIDSTRHGYQIHLVGRQIRHSFYVGMQHPFVKVLCSLVLLPEWPEWPHFAVAAGTTGLLRCCPQRSVQQTLACWVHTTRCILQCRVMTPRLCVDLTEALNLVFCLLTNPSRWKWASSLDHKQYEVALFTRLQTSDTSAFSLSRFYLITLCNLGETAL